MQGQQQRPPVGTQIATASPQLPAAASPSLPALTAGSSGMSKEWWCDQNVLVSVKTIAEQAAKSGFFSDVQDANKGVMKIMYGLSLGMDPVEALNSCYFVKGKGSVYAEAMLNAMALNLGIELEVIELNPEYGKVTVKKNGVAKGTVEYSIEIAKKQGLLKNIPWQVDPESMIWTKIVTRVQKRFGAGCYKKPVGVKEDLEDEEYLERMALIEETKAIGKRERKEKNVQAGTAGNNDQSDQVVDAESVSQSADSTASPTSDPVAQSAPATESQPAEQSTTNDDAPVTGQEVAKATAALKGKGWAAGSLTAKAKEMFPEAKTLTKLTRPQFNQLIEFAAANEAPKEQG